MRSIAGVLLGAALLATMLVAPAAAGGYGGIKSAELIGSVQGEGDSELCADVEVTAGVGAAEIVAYSHKTHQLFVTNGANDRIDVIDVSDPSDPQIVGSLDTEGGVNSVAVSPNGRILAAAVEGEEVDDNGFVRVWKLSKRHEPYWKGDAKAGALPDMVTFTPNGKAILVANEGEPNDEYTIDPEGSISIINPWKLTTRTADFHRFNGKEAYLESMGVRIFGPGATVAQDLEPEYITVDDSGKYAFVTLQENNAIAVVHIRKAKVKAVVGLGFKDWAALGLEFDASNRDDAINIESWPVYGMYQPDSIDSYTARNGRTYLVTANEGDARDYDGYSEEERVGDLPLDPTAFPDAGAWAPAGMLREDEYLGRLNITLENGDTDGDGDYDQIYAYGTRSFSIWNAHGKLVWDSGDEIEKITAAVYPDDGDLFNSGGVRNESTLFEPGDECDEIDNEFDDRSDDKGPEPEGLVVGRIGKRTYAFVGLERVGGVMVYDITRPWSPNFVDYLTNPGILTDTGLTGDVAPEGLLFIPAWKSPNGKNLLVVTHEVTGTTSIWQIKR